MTADQLIRTLDIALDTATFEHFSPDDQLALAVIWVIERVARELGLSLNQAAAHVALMCDITQVLESPQPTPEQLS